MNYQETSSQEIWKVTHGAFKKANIRRGSDLLIRPCAALHFLCVENESVQSSVSYNSLLCRRTNCETKIIWDECRLWEFPTLLPVSLSSPHPGPVGFSHDVVGPASVFVCERDKINMRSESEQCMQIVTFPFTYPVDFHSLQLLCFFSFFTEFKLL